jgi:hypothetical protein
MEMIMNPSASSQVVTVYIDRPLDVVYEFLCKPENFPRWASGLGESLARTGDRWAAQTPLGAVEVRFTERNRFGVLDHYVVPPNAAEIYIPMRVIANSPGTELMFTLFRQPDMSDEKFAADAEWVKHDLNTLKGLLELGQGEKS